MEDPTDTEDLLTASCNEHASNVDRTISSYGISIHTDDLQSGVIQEEDRSELQLLGINAYEQEQFERGILSQVDSAIAKAESNFHQNVTKKEIKTLEDEISMLVKEIEEIEQIFMSAKNGVPSATRRISFSLLQQKTSKENRLKQVQSDLEKKKQQLITLAENNDNASSTERLQKQNLIELGEITPFDALKLQGQSNKSTAQYTSTASQLTSNSIDTSLVNHDSAPIVEKRTCEHRDSVGGFSADKDNEKNTSKTKAKKNKKAVDDNESDEDYVPNEDITTDDEYHEDEEENINDGKRKMGSKQKAKSAGKTKAKKREKTIDDGDFNTYRERIRKIQIKKKLREARRKGEVSEEQFDFDFLSSDEGDDNDDDEEVCIEDDYVLPKKTWNKLYRYQRVGVKWLWQLHKHQTGGIVGDEMGLGKTIQVIAYFVGLMQAKTKQAMQSFQGHKGLGAVLIVCPGTVLHQWVDEFHKWCPRMRVAILHDSGSFVGKKATLIKAINSHPGVLVTTYAGVRLNKEELFRYYWHYVVLDEGHKIRNPNSEVTLACKQFDTPHRLILTGTPMQNSLKELWSLLDFVFPGRLGTLPVFMTEFSIPITMGGYANATPVQVQTAHRCATVLKDTINPYMLRRMKKDVQMVIQLPQKNEQVLFCKLSEEQKTMYEQYIKSSEVANILQGRMKVFPGLIKLRKICNHPDLGFFDQEDRDEGKDDSNTKDDMTDGGPQQLEHGFGYWKRSGKMLVVETLLRMWKEKGHRVLLFSQSKQMLNIMASFLQSVPYKFLRMDGGTNIASRQTIVKTFNQDPSIFIFLLTTRVGGLGLNLTAADRIIIFDPDWNPSTDTQARERAWRIGQDKHVTIYRLMTTGTIEEKIYHRQIFKQFLTNRVLTNPFQRRFFKSNDLYELFSLDDIGPMQSTETGAIFAGTGSEIRMRKKKRDKDKNLKRTASESLSSVKDSSSANKKTITMPLPCATKTVSNVMQGQSAKDKIHLTNKKLTSKKKKKKKKMKPVQIDGETLKNVEKMEKYKQTEGEEDVDDAEEKKEKKQSEDDVLQNLFRSSGLHSALKHDKIEQAGNPDYVLVEKEAQRVAKQAINALRQSRVQCRANGYSVPTWTGQNSTEDATPKKKRFGKRSGTQIASTSTTAPPKQAKTEEPSTSGSAGNVDNLKFNIESEAIDVSSSALLARMRRRNATLSTSVSSGDSASSQTVEDVLLRDIERFVKGRQNHTTTSDELAEFFKDRLKEGQNAMFKELLKQLCTLRKENGVGYWTLREDFK